MKIPAVLGLLAIVSMSVVAHAASPSAAGSTEAFRDCPDCPEMVVVPAGKFVMGAPASEPGFFVLEGPPHQVTIAKFAAGKFEVTRGQWARFVAATKRVTPPGCAWSPSENGAPDASWKKLGFPQSDTHPVVCINWNDVQDYLKWLSAQAGRPYRLLSEAEWEYAARAGSTTAFPWGTHADHAHANYGTEKCCGTGRAVGRDRWVYTSPVGSFPANAFGLYDTQGNVLQYVADCLAGSYTGLPADGSAYLKDVSLKLPEELRDLDGTSSCAYRMARGGDWGDPPDMIRSAARNFAPAPGATLETYRSGGLGFRVALSLTKQ